MNDLRRLLCLCACAFLLPLAAGAQTATLVRDINQGVEAGRFGGFGAVFHVSSVPGHLFFTAGTGGSMWASDGTAEGTFPLKDACPGPCESATTILGSLNKTLFWAGRSDDGWSYLWRSDGTRPGTFRLVEERIRFNSDDPFDLNPVPISSVAGGFFYFVSTTGGLDPSAGGVDTLWRTDGTRAGTQVVR